MTPEPLSSEPSSPITQEPHLGSRPVRIPSLESRPLRIAMVAGEASGDQLGAGLIRALTERWPQARFSGVGGEQMRAAGLDLWSDYRPLAVMGLFEVLRHLPRLLRFRAQLLRRLLHWQPDIFIGIDAPDFNLGVEQRLRRTGITTVHYVSPSVWAWRERRAAKIGASADCVLCLFPMEPKIYAQHGVDARFVGHPMADAFAERPDREAARAVLGLPPEAPVLAVLPGSRLGEIRRLAPVFLESARRLQAQRPNLQILVPAANAVCRDALAALLPTESRTLRVLDGHAHQAMVAADAVLLASGTAALEAALAKRPMVVGYRLAALSHFIVKHLGLLKISRYSLPNILHGGDLVPECMQHDCTPEQLLPALTELLDNHAARQAQLLGFDAIHRALRVPGGASLAAAEAIADLLERGARATSPSP